MDIRYVDNSAQVMDAFRRQCAKGLEMCGLTAEGYAKLLCPVDTGALRNSVTHKVSEGEGKCYVGTNKEYAAYVELGTGKYYAGGRKTPWAYQDGKGEWHWTRGQAAQPYLKPAVANHADEYVSLLNLALKGG